MGRILIIILSLTFLPGLNVSVFAYADEQEKKEKRQRQYEEILALVKSGQFIFEADRAFPQSGSSIDLTTNYGYLKVTDSVATAELPYFGRAYNVDYGGNGGINFSGKANETEISENPAKMRIQYSFEVKDRDIFKIMMEIGYDGDTSLSVISNDRAAISYSGKISAVEEEEQ
jgi:hypothetical protein